MRGEGEKYTLLVLEERNRLLTTFIWLLISESEVKIKTSSIPRRINRAILTLES